MSKSRDSASTTESIWLVTNDKDTAVMVPRTLDSDAGLGIKGVCGDLVELVQCLEREPTPAAIVDIDPQPSRILHDLETIISRYPNTRFVVISSRFSNELILEAMQVGARHFVLKEAIATDLMNVLKRLAASSGRKVGGRDEQGQIVTVLSAGGGCGSTTIAVNIANEFGILTKSPALIVDMDAAYGSVATYLGLGGDYGVADILSRYGGMDPQLVRTTALSFSDQLHALISPCSVDFSNPHAMAFDQVDEVLLALRSAYSRTVIDAPRLPMEVTARLAMGSAATLIVGQLSVKDIRTARSIRTALLDRGVPSKSIKFIAGRYTRRGMLSRDDAERGLGGAEVDVVCNDFRSASRSVNVGEPLAQVAPRSGLRHDVQRIANDISKRIPSAATER